MQRVFHIFPSLEMTGILLPPPVHTERNCFGGMLMDTFSLILVILSALDWGLVGFLRFDPVAWFFGGQTANLSRVVYAVFGIAGLWCAAFLFRRKKR